MQYCQVVVDGTPFVNEEGFDYKVPPALEAHIRLGSIVYIPFGKNNQIKKGFVIALSEKPNDTNIEVKSVVLPHSFRAVVDVETMALCKFLADYYSCALIYALNLVTPKYLLKNATVALRHKKTETLQCIDEKYLAGIQNEDIASEYDIVEYNPLHENNQRYFTLRKDASYNDKQEWLVTLRRAPKQNAIFNLLMEDNIVSEEVMKERFGNVCTQLKALEEKGYIERTSPSLADCADINTRCNDIMMTADQKNVYDKLLEAVERKIFSKHLINGVTGSGKTLIYEMLAQQILAKRQQILVLVPEIALSNQLYDRFKDRFPNRIALLHSQLSDRERYIIWKRVKNNEIDIVVGPRSALFLPFNTLGLIIIDEEHDSSYKQSEPDPRYHAITVAEYIAKRENALLLLGSATPSVETLYEVVRGQCCIHNLVKRANESTLPQIHLVDMAEDRKEGNHSILSDKLKEEITVALKRSEQVIILINKKGFASSVSCQECGEIVKCPKCDIPLTYYQSSRILKCNYCEFQMPMIKACPSCGNTFLRQTGIGTETVEEECKRLFKNAHVARLDAQSMSHKKVRNKLFSAYANQEIDILIGTQLLAKGFDFTNTTCIGVVNADLTLNLPDFRSAERCFQLMVQVAGRAGRDNKPSNVYIQTYQKEHYAFKNALEQNMHQFFLDEIAFRKQWLYPPIVRLCRIIVSDYNVKHVELAIRSIYNYIVGLDVQMQVIGPAFAPLPKKNNRYRMHLIIKAKTIEDIHIITASYRENMHRLGIKPTTRVLLDVDPENIF